MIKNVIYLTPTMKRTLLRWLVDGEIDMDEADDILHGEEARQRRQLDARTMMRVMYEDNPDKWREKAARLNALADGTMTIDEYIAWADEEEVFY